MKFVLYMAVFELLYKVLNILLLYKYQLVAQFFIRSVFVKIKSIYNYYVPNVNS